MVQWVKVPTASLMASLTFRTYTGTERVQYHNAPLISTRAVGSVCSHKLHTCSGKHALTQKQNLMDNNKGSPICNQVSWDDFKCKIIKQH